jgi:uncharacterized protein
MLTNSFVHIPGVGPKMERKLWKQGILSWKDFMTDYLRMELPEALKEQGLEIIEESESCIARFNPEFFDRRLPRSENWRLYGNFENETAFVDIETNGGFGYDAITVIGVYDGKEYRHFVREQNLLDAAEELLKYKLIVTYNGQNFDMPIIYDMFPSIKRRHLHLDVMYPLRRLGYRGGLKKVEEALGITRSHRTKGMNGWDAVRLWQEYYNSGKESSIELLLKYNCEDCKHLKPLAEFAYNTLKKQVFDRYTGK